MAFSATQDYAAKRKYTIDWTADLGSALISSQTVTGPTGAVISSITRDGTNKKVTFLLASTGITTPTVLPIVCHIVMDDGEEDEKTMNIQVTNT